MKNLHLILILLLFITNSCLKDVPEDFNNPESEWNPSFSVPIGYTTLAMNEESGFNMALFNDLDNSGFPDWIDEIDIPFNYSIPFNMSEITPFSEQIVQIMFRINTYNGFPAIAKGQIYFQDESFQIIDSAFVDGALSVGAGTIIGNGEEIHPTYLKRNIFIDGARLDKFLNVRNILIEGAIENLLLDTALIDFYRNYTLDVQLGLQVELKLSLQQ